MLEKDSQEDKKEQKGHGLASMMCEHEGYKEDEKSDFNRHQEECLDDALLIHYRSNSLHFFIDFLAKDAGGSENEEENDHKKGKDIRVGSAPWNESGCKGFNESKD